MATNLLWATMETPDGLFIPGPHGTSAASEIYPGISSGVAFIISGGEVLLVDSGYRTPSEYPAGVLSTICDVLDQRNLRLKCIVQTHGHFDHIGNTRYLKERYDAKVVCHPKDKVVIEDPVLYSRPEYMESMGGNVAEVAEDLGLEDPADVLPKEAFVREYWNFPVEVDETVEDGDALEVGDLRIQVLHTPGHTPGHLSLYNPSSRSLYISDLMYWPSPSSPYPIGSVDDQIASIKKCLALDIEFLFPGHELPRCGESDSRDYLTDLLIKQQQLELRILLALSRHGALSVPELHAESFILKERYDYPSGDWWGKSINCVYGHLRRLEQQGRVVKVLRDDGKTAWEVTEMAKLEVGEVSAVGGYQRSVEKCQNGMQDLLA